MGHPGLECVSCGTDGVLQKTPVMQAGGVWAGGSQCCPDPGSVGLGSELDDRTYWMKFPAHPRTLLTQTGDSGPLHSLSRIKLLALSTSFSLCVCFKRIIITIHSHCKLSKCPSFMVLTFVIYKIGMQIAQSPEFGNTSFAKIAVTET